MEQNNNTEDNRKGKHLTYNDRITIEVMSRRGIPPRGIASVVRKSRRTIERELVRGRVIHLDTELREKEVREAVALVAAIPEVRKFVVETLQSLENFGSLVMEGRDIGTVVFPDTPFKFYLDADPEERAKRRYRELVAAGENEKAEEVMKSLQQRDQIDSTRKTAPLSVAPGARVVDTTNMTLDEVIETIVKAIKEFA